MYYTDPLILAFIRLLSLLTFLFDYYIAIVLASLLVITVLSLYIV